MPTRQSTVENNTVHTGSLRPSKFSRPSHHKRPNARKLLLSSTRPTFSVKHANPSPLPSNASRALIRKHHTLSKNLSLALRSNDQHLASQIQTEIASLGGLKRYQDASLSGQRRDRGGDTGSVLVQWLSEAFAKRDKNCANLKQPETMEQQSGLRMLEVGALSVDGACARSGLFRSSSKADSDGTAKIDGGIERIDLKSRHPSIREIDFMDLELPQSGSTLENEGYDIVNLSLVLNFVGDPVGRAEMLKRVALLLRCENREKDQTEEDLFPSLFLVLPAPCVTNSRYMDEDRLGHIMQALGYKMVQRKLSAKLVYYLWRYDGGFNAGSEKKPGFGKQEIRKGKDRNNFAVVLK